MPSKKETPSDRLGLHFTDGLVCLGLQIERVKFSPSELCHFAIALSGLYLCFDGVDLLRALNVFRL